MFYFSLHSIHEYFIVEYFISILKSNQFFFI